ncbi:winged helix-turn-helix domain-containing protein [Mycobacterium sp. OTB74]|jgi:DNA-binding transcriptional ArsR family regulator|uniref:ArsR/SmtB family transcription factor n=1 Tax=Mycobacterium sp. OTB74 TaxID=1853452 RepID=UPI00247311C0|nr:winged helix-turn-helix domain-containing protein [Mycobacterium sp. OTB74]MDH6247702.1 DNA-binding transcriptional ArsR family regulator [Mycobacterium sp. OTB74]
MPTYAHSVPDIAAIGRLLGDDSRAAMTLALMDGRAWTVGEIARYLGIAKSTATEHAHRLVDGGLLTEAHQGRHRYLRLAGPDVAEAVEALGALSGTMLTPQHTLSAGTRDTALRAGRTCYRHLAGRLGVDLVEALHEREIVTRDWELGPNGADWFAQLDITPQPSRKPLLRACLDWTERRDHLAGAYGDALCDHLLRTSWLARRGTTRAVRLTDKGRAELAQLGIDL